jgi:hypothetical protein
MSPNKAASKCLLEIFMVSAGIVHFVNPAFFLRIITPHPSKLCTEMATTKEMIQWADARASFSNVPEFVMNDWGIEIPEERIW